ncbi:double-cubane-cluster-containing anaerobic reductase [Desulfurivibrio alkaliphilus]|uniref:2-hydroxyglutaryl-CoA dehydratase D-component n=1 Tax=Desulfurivibrio alkaliphilus (strain DSM 19089 / UNIQEM U267 / AHT2) TaxID=589865 RepID=D6Z1X5_DESAT|nr:double-cubane-cluster-containing anaerobic reductase [Desulfurivibrio alkaliphilus]ADH85550.1 2-hydroxyglutaryl-CoA dehydratase D-component [Desulfurivibrio alkaliphilus AHT 2]
MEHELGQRMRKTTRLHLAMEGEETLQRLAEFPERLAAMDYFYSLFRDLANGAGPASLAGGRKIVATMCMQVPQELILAVGAYPWRLCSGANAYDQVGAEFMPAKSCPVVRSTLGMLKLNQSLWGEDLGGVVVPTTCDQKKKACEQLAALGYPVYSLEMPAGKDSELSRYYWQESVKQFAIALERMVGRRVTAAGLRQAIGQVGRAAALFRQLHRLRGNRPPLILGSDLFLVYNAYFLADIERWCQAVEALLAELEQRRQGEVRVTNRRAPRLLFTGSPPIFPNFKLPVLVEQSGGIIVADESCSSTRLLSDAVAYDEAGLNDMVPAVADRYLKPCTCPCLTPNHDRLRKLLAMIDEFAVDGVVYQAFSGCLPYEMERRQVNEILSARGTPMLYVETDYSPEDSGQLSTRVEAFIESIKARKRKTARKKREI